MSGGVDRLAILGILLTCGGLALCARGAYRLSRAVRARFTYGAPYRIGTIADRLLGLALEIPFPLMGSALLFLAMSQAGFQPNEGTIRAGQIEARRSAWGSIVVRFIPDPSYPAHAVLEGEISGARWAIAGDFITWDRRLRWLGLRDGHRVRYLIGARDSSGLARAGSDDTRVLEPLPRAASRLVALRHFIPFLTVKMEASPWFMPADREVMVLYAIGPGYLADVASEGRRHEASPN